MDDFEGKLLIFTAPSGAGKTTIVRHLMDRFDVLDFSVSATSRDPRPGEIYGQDYYFFKPTAFQQLIRDGAFVEWEEVYPGQFYGTLHSELQRLWKERKHILFDIDVQGALNLKKQYQQRALSIFVKPPSLEALFERLRRRQTEDPASLQKRMAKAEEELSFENNFDYILVNDVLDAALVEAENLVHRFLNI